MAILQHSDLMQNDHQPNQLHTAPMNTIQEFNLSYPLSTSNPADKTPMNPALQKPPPSKTLNNSSFNWLSSSWLKNWLNVELNFYRCHLLTFIFIPCIFAIVFYIARDTHLASSQQMKFLDCLFMCYSAMTMTGLNTILLASLNRFQQVLLYILMSIGSTTMVSIVMVYVRLGVFKQRFQSIIHSTHPLVISRPIPPPDGPPIQLNQTDTSPERNDENIPNSTQPGSIFHTLGSQSNVSFEPSSSREARNKSITVTTRTKQLANSSSYPLTQQLQPHDQFVPLTDSPPKISPVDIDFPKQQISSGTSRRPPLVRRNSDGGVVGARSSFANFEYPSDSSTRLESSRLLSILKSSQGIPGHMLSNNMNFKQSTRQNTQINRTVDLFPRSATLDQSPAFHPSQSNRFRAASLARDRSLTFALEHNLLDEVHGAAQEMTTQMRSHRFTKNENHPSPLFSVNPFTCKPRGNNPVVPVQPGWILGVEPDLPGQNPDTRTSHEWRPRRSLSTVARDHTAEGLRRRNRPPRTSSVSNPQTERPRSASNATRGSRYIQSQQSISGQSNGNGGSQNRKIPGTPFPRTSSVVEGFGGFPNPIFLIFKKIFLGKKRFASWFKQVTGHGNNSLEFVRTSSLAPHTFDHHKEKIKLLDWFFPFDPELISQRIRNVKTVSYIKFNAIVGRNSNFLTLTSAQEEELGGLEYRALSILLKILIGYWIILQVLAVVILIPYLETPRGDKRFSDVFEGPGGTSRAWYAIWITCSSFTNGGMSLIDAGFTVFREAYLLMLTCSILIIAGNTGYPIMLRAIIWTLSKICPESTPEERRKVGGGMKDVLNFLLDHPRRCFVYLFPTRQTWYLLLILLTLTSIDWICFLILDIGNPKIESIPIRSRIVVGLLQSLSVRAAGFSTVSLGDLAPAVQVLFLIMMYIAVYPIAISIRATNVYEERSMGIFDPQELHEQPSPRQDVEEEEVVPRGRNPQLGPSPLSNDPVRSGSSSSSASRESGHHKKNGIRNRLFPKIRPRQQSLDPIPDPHADGLQSASSYFAFHIRKQLAFDIWWLALAVWCICIAERNKIITVETPNSSFSIFSVIFEVVSAYGTIGLSFGLSDSATSMVGGFSPFSKLIVIVVMLRGRHRGLPIAIDRAVLFPYEKVSQINSTTGNLSDQLDQNHHEHEHQQELKNNQIPQHDSVFDSPFPQSNRPHDIESQ